MLLEKTGYKLWTSGKLEGLIMQIYTLLATLLLLLYALFPQHKRRVGRKKENHFLVHILVASDTKHNSASPSQYCSHVPIW